MHRLNRLLPALALFAFILFFPSETRADPLVITGGTVSIGGTPFSRNAWRQLGFDFSGQNAQVSLSVGDGSSTRVPQTSCASGPCQIGTLVSVNSSFSAEGIGSASINGTSYAAWFGSGDTNMTFTTGSVLFPGSSNDASTITLSTHFTMTGTLVIRDLDDNFSAVFTSPIIGEGTAFLTFTRLSTGYWLSNVTYQFSQVTQTPEPATLILLGTGLASAAAYRRRRRRGGGAS